MPTPKLTPTRVEAMTAPADPGHITVVCEDENGATHNVYLRDEDVGAEYAALRQRRQVADTAHADERKAAEEVLKTAHANADSKRAAAMAVIAGEAAPLDTAMIALAKKEIAAREKKESEVSSPSPE